MYILHIYTDIMNSYISYIIYIFLYIVYIYILYIVKIAYLHIAFNTL